MRDAIKEAETERVAVVQQLHAAQESLQGLDVLLAAGASGAAATLVRGRAAAARSQVDEAVWLLTRRGEPLPELVRVPCSFCGQLIMPAATLCGFCWRKRKPTTG